jgi:hypothetical protein
MVRVRGTTSVYKRERECVRVCTRVCDRERRGYIPAVALVQSSSFCPAKPSNDPIIHTPSAAW